MFILPLCLIFLCLHGQVFLKWNERRPGVVLNDPVLAYLPNRNMSFHITLLDTIIAACSFYQIYLNNNWQAYEVFWAKFTITMFFKMVTLFLTPLNPPIGYIPLPDVFLDTIMQTHDEPLGKDLFFSGHTSFAVLALLYAPEYQVIYLLSLFCTATMLLINRVHYTVDVIMAPFVVYTVHSLMDKYLTNYIINLDQSIIDYFQSFLV
jgi:hypothetical protein